MKPNKFTPGSTKGRKINLASNHKNVARFIKALLKCPMTYYELAEETGIYYDTITSLMKTLKAEKVVHICDWKADKMGRYQLAVYSLGEGMDKEKPLPLSMSYRQKRYKNALKAQNEPIFQPKTTFVGGGLWQ